MSCKNCRRSRLFKEGLFFASAVLPIPRSRLPELRYRLEIQNGRSHWHYLDVLKFSDDPISSLDFSFIGGVPLMSLSCSNDFFYPAMEIFSPQRIAPVDEWIRLTKTSFIIDPEIPRSSHIKLKCKLKMLQFKIYINKITYLASVYLIKVEGGGGRLCKSIHEFYVCESYGICVEWGCAT